MVTAYPVHGKQKAYDICKAFVDGCGGSIDTKLQPGPAFFFGVNETNLHIWKAVLADGRDYFYCDNSFFDGARQAQFRVSKNALQHSGLGTSDGKRFKELGIELKPWTSGGDHIVVVEQSEPFMRMVVGSNVNWRVQTVDALQRLTKRPIRLRPWSPDKGKLAKTLPADLAGAHALVTWSSAAAITAVLDGVPIVTMGQCAAEPMAGSLLEIENLPRPEREEWAGVLADQQWTLAEMRSGLAWRSLNG